MHEAGLIATAVHEGLADHGLARAHFAGDQAKALVHADGVLDGGHGLLVADFAHESNGFRHHDDMFAIEEERPFVVIAIGEPDDADGHLQGQRLLDDAAAGD